MLENLRNYCLRPIWETVFVYFPMPFRAILILIFLSLIVWIIFRLKNFLKELFRLFLEVLLLPEYFLGKFYQAKGNNFPNWLKYGEVLNRVALRIIPLKENSKTRNLSIKWFIIVSLIFLSFYPIWTFREQIKAKIPTENAVLKWSSIENWLLTGDLDAPADCYWDFYAHKVQKNESIFSIAESYNKPPEFIILPDDIIWANQSKYPTINKTYIESDWILIIPIRKSFVTPNSYSNLPNTNRQEKLYRVQTRNKSGLNIRLYKDLSSESVTFVPENGEVVLLYFDNEFDEIDGRKGKWCRVKANGKEGWAWGWYLIEK